MGMFWPPRSPRRFAVPALGRGRPTCLRGGRLAALVAGLALAGCEPEGPQPTLARIEPQEAYSDQDTLVRLVGTQFVPPFTLDLAQDLRVPQASGFSGVVFGAGGSARLRDVVWKSPTELEAVLEAGLSGAPGYSVTVRDPRGQQATLANGFIALGADTVPPDLVIEAPTPTRLLGPGVAVRVDAVAQDFGPGKLSDLRYEIALGPRRLVDGRCALAAHGGSTRCSFDALAPPEAAPGALFRITVKAIDAGPLANQATQTLVFVLSPPPSLSAIAPASGSREGGTDVVITGKNFAPASQVRVGGALLWPDGGRMLDAQTIVGRTPPGAVGAVDVTFEGPTGTSTTAGAFTYLEALAVTDVSPGQVAAAGGTLLTIAGDGFTKDTLILFGDRPTNAVPLLDITWESPSRIRGFAPQGTGATSVWATAPGLGRARWSGTFVWTPAVEVAP
ncbi:MAG: IPT/TIG domain-containing protein [Myxococcales bacterium]|nr:IPT/TIG domain-containing protein [Myxococcales bacterium]